MYLNEIDLEQLDKTELIEILNSIIDAVNCLNNEVFKEDIIVSSGFLKEY